MLILEFLLLGSMFYLCIMSSISDCRQGIIPNRLLLRVLFIAFFLNSIYYVVYMKNGIFLFFFNLFCIAVFAIFFYIYNLWAAGDSKLLFVSTMCIPFRIYTYYYLGPFPGFAILVLIFSTAFIYVIGDSIIQGIKHGDLLHFEKNIFNFKFLLLSYFFMVAALTLCHFLLWELVGRFIQFKGMLINSIDFLIVLTLIQWRNKLSYKKLCVLTMLLWGILLIFGIIHIIAIPNVNIDFKLWVIVLVVMIFRMISEKYNYQMVSVDHLRPRMIPSAKTVFDFSSSKIKGLPQGMTEDLRSRMTEEEIYAIKRWQQSKQGKDSIMIVRKMPFAIFISIGTFLFVLMEGILIWRGL